MITELEDILGTLGFEPFIPNGWHRDEEHLLIENDGRIELFRMTAGSVPDGDDDMIMKLPFLPDDPVKCHLVRETIKFSIGL